MIKFWEKGLEFFIHGGWIMYPMALIAIVGIAVALERYLTIREAVKGAKQMNDVVPLLKSGKFDQALQFCESKTGPVAATVAAGLRTRDLDLPDVERAMEEAAAKELPLLNARLGVLDTVITMAPLMGLLGTITGMISAFAVVAGPGAAEKSAALTGGVGEALIATATGLGTAIAILPVYNYLTERVKDVSGEIETRATELLNQLARHRASNGGTTSAGDPMRHSVLPSSLTNSPGNGATSVVNHSHRE